MLRKVCLRNRTLIIFISTREKKKRKDSQLQLLEYTYQDHNKSIAKITI